MISDEKTHFDIDNLKQIWVNLGARKSINGKTEAKAKAEAVSANGAGGRDDTYVTQFFSSRTYIHVSKLSDR